MKRQAITVGFAILGAGALSYILKLSFHRVRPPSSVNFIVYFLIEPYHANILKVNDRVATEIKLAFDAPNIDMPYPHTVVVRAERPPLQSREDSER